MKRRCDSKTDPWFDWYGGKGIGYDPRWSIYEVFVADMGERPVGTTLERKDNSLGYFKENCKWGTPREQTLNRSLTRWMTHKGRTQCLTDWARELGVSAAALSWRLRQGWSDRKTLTRSFKADARRGD